ncbi:MAG: hypothetical protein KDD64_06100 [Bdellovibrionales bacterium]|nr:hypothetical protein [Bdellovibrionales bacterium]
MIAVLAKAVVTLAGLMSVPWLLGYFGDEQYALWAIVATLAGWGSLLQFGFLGVLLNQTAHAYGKNDISRIGTLVQFVVVALALVGSLASILILAFADEINWATLLNFNRHFSHHFVATCIVASLVPAFLSLPLRVAQPILTGFQESFVWSLFEALTAISVLCCIWVCGEFSASILWLISSVAGASFLLFLVLFLYTFRVRHPPLLSSSLRSMRLSMGILLPLAAPFFFLQVGYLLINNSQAFVLAHFVSVDAVMKYAVLITLIETCVGFIFVTTQSFLAPLREAYSRGDIDWFRTAKRRFLFFRIGFALLGGAALLMLGNQIIYWWIREHSFVVNFDLRLLLAVTMVGSVWVSSVSEILIVMDHVWSQVICVLLNGCVTFGLSVWLAPKLGLVGIFVAFGGFTLLILSWVLPLILRPSEREWYKNLSELSRK